MPWVQVTGSTVSSVDPEDGVKVYRFENVAGSNTDTDPLAIPGARRVYAVTSVGSGLSLRVYEPTTGSSLTFGDEVGVKRDAGGQSYWIDPPGWIIARNGNVSAADILVQVIFEKVKPKGR